MTFSREAWPFVVPFAVVTAVLLAARQPAWAAVAFVLTVAFLLFFRVPRRRSQGDEGAVLAAADGLVTRVDEIEDGELGRGRYHRVVTFLSVFDVHVQRVPVDGRVLLSRHRPGRKRAAFRADAGEVNESQLTVIETATGERIGVRQIAGLLARRVVCYLQPGQTVRRGELMGLIRFGSRVDLLLPPGYQVGISRGQRAKSGMTVVARRNEGVGSDGTRRAEVVPEEAP